VFNEVLYFTAAALRNVIYNLSKKLTLMKNFVRYFLKFFRTCLFISSCDVSSHQILALVNSMSRTVECMH